MRIKILIIAVFLGLAGVSAQAATTIEAPAVALAGIPFAVVVHSEVAGDLSVRPGTGQAVSLPADNGDGRRVRLSLDNSGPVVVVVIDGERVVASATVQFLPGWASLLPPLLAIGIALIFRQVIPALFIGIWSGVWAASGFSGSGFVIAIFDSFQILIRNAVADPDHASIILFSLMIGGMVGIVMKNGGMQGIVDFFVARGTNTAKRGQLTTWLLGILIFFDDYANSLVVGNTMRSITDRLRVSREKLAYIVDSTAAPVASVAIVTTWIGFEVGLIGDATAGLSGLDQSAYGIFLNSILYNFYPFLALLMVWLVAHTGRDFGPMLKVERQMRATGKVPDIHHKMAIRTDDGLELDSDATPLHHHLARLAVVPILTLIAVVLLGLYLGGEGDSFQEFLGSLDSYKAMMWGSLAAVLVAIVLSVGYRVLSLEAAILAWTDGVKAMMFAMIVLTLAWSLSATTGILHTADYLVSILGDSLSPAWVPAVVFVISAATGFATGTSWGAMGILVPLVLPLTWAIMQAGGMAGPEELHILYNAVAAILGGAVWGDHCSPISDTTVLSSMASGCDHIEHVRTQLPYAVVTGAAALFVGIIPAAFGAPWWLMLGLGGGALALFLRYFGDDSGSAAQAA